MRQSRKKSIIDEFIINLVESFKLLFDVFNTVIIYAENSLMIKTALIKSSNINKYND